MASDDVELAALALKLAGRFGSEVIDRRRTPGGDADGYYVPTRRAHYLIRVVDREHVQLVRDDVAPPRGRWVSACSEPRSEDWTSAADDDESYATLRPTGAEVTYSHLYLDDAAIGERLPPECCRLFLALERSLDRPLSLVLERFGAVLDRLPATNLDELDRTIDAATLVLAAVR